MGLRTAAAGPDPNNFPIPTPQYEESRHGGLQALPSGYPQTAPLPAFQPSMESKPWWPTSVSGTDPGYVVGEERQQQGRPRKRVTCWVIAAVVAVLLVAGVIGGAVGGTRKGKTTSSSVPQSPTSTAPSSDKTATRTAIATPTSTAIKTPVNLGCYYDDSARALREGFFSDPSMTPHLCDSLCPGYPYYAVEYGIQCLCGNVVHDIHPKVEDSDCDYVCGGDSTTKCGGFWRFNLYSSTGAPAPAVVNSTAQGCFIDQPNRGLPNVFVTDDRMTPELCTGLCAQYRYAGVEYGTQCFCGNEWPTSYPKVDDRDCNYTCAGDPKLTCGAFWRLNLYAIEL